MGYTMAEYLEMQARSKTVESLVLNDRRSVVMTEAGLPEAVIQEYFSPNAFDFFGVPPLFGRTFSRKRCRRRIESRTRRGAQLFVLAAPFLRSAATSSASRSASTTSSSP